MANFSKKRRNFLRTAITAGAGLWFLQKFFAPVPVAKTLLARVPMASVPGRGALVYRQQRFALIREAGNVYALSLVCTHLGCTLSVTPKELSCPCHGSVFDRYGLELQQQGEDWLVYG
jgi:Rieske Fe-S protein